MLQKRILIADRVRRPPREGFSWVDRRFLRATRCNSEAGRPFVARCHLAVFLFDRRQ